MFATLALVGLLAQVAGPADFQPAGTEIVDTVQVQEQVDEVYGVARVITTAVKQFLPDTITEAWLLAAAFNVFTTVMLLAKLMGWIGWWRIGLDVAASFALAAKHFLPDTMTFLIAATALSAVTVVSIKVASEGGDRIRGQLEKRNLAPKARGEFNRGPSRNPGNDS